MSGARSGVLPTVEEDTGWIAATLQNSWVNYGSGLSTAAYRRVNGMVFVKGVVKNGTVGVGVAVFTLPAGFRPAEDHSPTLCASNGNAGFIDVKASGLVNFQPRTGSSNSYYSLDQLHPFPAEA